MDDVIISKTKRSLINRYFTKEVYLELLKITMMGDISNNEKNAFVKTLLTEYNIPFSGLGPGTNRMAVLIDGYAVKIALDKDGMIDNKREFLYTKNLQPFVIKVYECTPCGLLAVSEFVELFTLNDFHIYQDEMKEILEKISSNFLIGDVGITTANYLNWGIRTTGEICILDFASIYSVEYNVFNCTCDSSALLVYDRNYVNLICPVCNKKYKFIDLRQRITRKQQEAEIGDIRRLGYNLTKDAEEVTLNPEFEPKTKKKKKKKSETDKLIEEYLEEQKYGSDNYQTWD